jgi:hypothetical protein
VKREQLIDAFIQLGKVMKSLGEGKDFPSEEIGITEQEYEQLQVVINRQFQYNGWFTKESVKEAFLGIASWLTEEKLSAWTSQYAWTEQPKKVGIIMAGNIPLVGFHDFLSVLMSGNSAICKMSSDDKTLLPALVQLIVKFEPELSNRIVLSEGRIGTIDAVIATGSNNSMLYFEQYFGKYPHIFRKNRTSIAVLDGSETEEELTALGKDIFTYFGLGCRNVSHLLLPEGYDFANFFKGIFPHSDVINHFKYGNNYDYNKAVYLMNQLPLLDNNFVLLRESDELHPPLAMIHYHFYKNEEEVANYIQQHQEAIQVVVGKDNFAFGQTQQPTLTDYADNVDTMLWLNQL